MPGTVGTKAPDVSLHLHDGSTVKLSAFEGHQSVVLFFYPKDNTPGCTNQACNLQDNLGTLTKHDIQVIGISPDANASHEKFATKYDLSFPLVADTDHKIIEKYGVWGEKKNYGKTYMGLHRTTFLIDPKGKIVHVFTKPKTKEHAEEILAKVNELR